MLLAGVGINGGFKTARDMYRHAGIFVDDKVESVIIPEKLVDFTLENAPSEFKIYGNDPEFQDS